MAEQGDLGQRTRAIHQAPQLGEDHGQQEGHGSAEQPGQQTRRTCDARAEIRRQKPSGADGAGDHRED